MLFLRTFTTKKMKAVTQRVTRASVSIGGVEHSAIGKGCLILLGVHEDDSIEDVQWLARKVSSLRIFSDAGGVMNLPITAVGGEVLVVSQFTLLASYKKGNRPSWIHAARHEVSIPLYEAFCDAIRRDTGARVATGEFGADMQVSLVNDGPVTICMDTRHKE